ncbi:RepB family plasmid replication initiator protein [Paenibacillus agricola]|uniref:RepB family plasmid replication initiator protein n=1 Tax=Paenibacillus agricola TaxID=2716264 RepID=A0ABX0JD26_9BACL|nr:RepB family plasmid replication initiator protein [Paenibacillus agricola]NHN33154.1 RepB family plasmid replication initiator protein [Paenibacillus agricola]
MAQKIQDILTNDIPFLVNRKKNFKSNDMSEDEIMRAMDSDISRLAKSLIRCNLHELKSMFEKISKQETELLRESFNLQSSKKAVPDETYIELSKAQILASAIGQAITLKRELNRQSSDHPLDNNIITGGLFVAASPKPKTLKKYEKIDVDTFGSRSYIEIDRKKIAYKNTRGVVLSQYDGRVFLSVTKNWLLQGRPQTVELELKDIAREMNTTPSGGEYKTIRNSLDNIFATEIIMKEYYDPEIDGIYSTKDFFHIVSNLRWIARTQEEDGKERKVSITFHDRIYNNMLAGNYVFLNMIIYTELPTAFAKICYQHIIKAAVNNVRTLDIDDLLDIIQIDTGNRARAAQDVQLALTYLQDQDVITSFQIRAQGAKKQKFVDFEPSNWILQQNKTTLFLS